jgi:hypothetical protein
MQSLPETLQAHIPGARQTHKCPSVLTLTPKHRLLGYACHANVQSPTDPLELAFRPTSAFQKAGESEELKQLRFQHHEQMRQVGMF